MCTMKEDNHALFWITHRYFKSQTAGKPCLKTEHSSVSQVCSCHHFLPSSVGQVAWFDINCGDTCTVREFLRCDYKCSQVVVHLSKT